jgi:hypothetical protein
MVTAIGGLSFEGSFRLQAASFEKYLNGYLFIEQRDVIRDDVSYKWRLLRDASCILPLCGM